MGVVEGSPVAVAVAVPVEVGGAEVAVSVGVPTGNPVAVAV